jgi:hypothetical protein
MKELNLLDEAQLKNDFRRTYKEIGMSGCVQVLYELITAANILSEVMLEEYKK